MYSSAWRLRLCIYYLNAIQDLCTLLLLKMIKVGNGYARCLNACSLFVWSMLTPIDRYELKIGLLSPLLDQMQITPLI